MTTYQVQHRTTYHYTSSITSAQLRIVLTPRRTAAQQVAAAQLAITPEPEFVHRFDDHLGNHTTYVSIAGAHAELHVVADSRVTVQPAGPCADLDRSWESIVAATAADRSADGLLARDLRVASHHVPLLPEMQRFALSAFRPGRPLREAIAALTQTIYRDFTFDPEFSEISTPIADVLAQRRGVCQDFAHLLIGCLRSVGLGARYVSGYLETMPPPGAEKLQGADASHAWCSFFVPGAGWFDTDPTNDQFPPTHHVVVAWGRDYADVAPVSGVLFGPPTSQRVEVAVDVIRVG